MEHCRKIINPDCVESFTIWVHNTQVDDGGTYTFSAFDVTRIVRNFQPLGGRGVPPPPFTNATADYRATIETTKSSPIVISGFNYYSDNPNQLLQGMKFVRASLDGKIKEWKPSISSARRNTQFQNNLLTIDHFQVIDDQTALEVEILGQTSVYITFFVLGFIAK